jgi:DivIVA protein
MNWNEIERIRRSGFPEARRGYEQRSVDKFVAELADWLETDAAKEIGQLAVTRKLELVGKSTAHILLTAEQESEQMRRRAEDECEAVRSEAEADALATRQAADDYAKKVREKAELDARQRGDVASAKAKQTVEEGERRRAEIEELVKDLKARRDRVLAELDHLKEEIVATIESHRPGKRSDGGTLGQPPERGPAIAPPGDGEESPKPRRATTARSSR